VNIVVFGKNRPECAATCEALLLKNHVVYYIAEDKELPYISHLVNKKFIIIDPKKTKLEQYFAPIEINGIVAYKIPYPTFFKKNLKAPASECNRTRRYGEIVGGY